MVNFAVDGGGHTRKLQHKARLARHYYARGMAKSSSAVGEPPVKRFAHEVFGHPTVLSLASDGRMH
jgi:hypothetical protein